MYYNYYRKNKERRCPLMNNMNLISKAFLRLGGGISKLKYINNKDKRL